MRSATLHGRRIILEAEGDKDMILEGLAVAIVGLAALASNDNKTTCHCVKCCAVCRVEAQQREAELVAQARIDVEAEVNRRMMSRGYQEIMRRA